MRKHFITLLLVLLSAVCMQAQSISKQINDIKRSTDYLCAEQTDVTAERAHEVAQELLAHQIEEYVADHSELKQAVNVIVKDVATKAERLQMNRGEMVRVFLYVKKTDIMAAKNTQVLVQPANKIKPEVSTVLDVQVSQTPEEHIAVSVSDETSVVSSPVVSVPSMRPEASTVASSLVDDEGGAPSATWQQVVINELLACTSVKAAQQSLQRQQRQMRVKRYGTPDRCRRPDSAFFIIFDEVGHVSTILGPAQDGKRHNFSTGDSDTLSNHSGQNAIWFTLSN